MHHLAEYGVAAHWRYKEGGKRDTKFEEKVAWLRQLMDWQKEWPAAPEFVESLKTDMFQDQVYVFTPKGEIKELPPARRPLTSPIASTPTSATAAWARKSTGGWFRWTQCCGTAISSR